MRLTILLGLCVGWTLLGAICQPSGRSEYDGLPATSLSVSIQSPSTDVTIPQGTRIAVRWAAYNATDLPGTARLYVESRTDLAQTVLAEGITVTGGSVTRDTAWDTTDVEPGVYVIYAEIVTAEDSASTSGAGRITVDAFPTFEFTQPTEDAIYTKEGDALTIGWSGADPEDDGEVTIGLDPDTDHESGDEIFIKRATLSDTEEEQTFDWEGDALSVDEVPAGTYYLFAAVSDSVNPERIFDAGIRITVEEASEDEDEENVGLAITKPSEDTTFLSSDASLRIEFTVNEFDDVLIDIKIDTDDNHTNGNEGTILSQRVVPGGTESDTFDWNGRYSDDTAVPAGIYRLFILMNTGSGTPESAEGEGLVFRRTYAKQPLIALLSPATQQTVEAGDYVTIRWRDDDPNAQAKIRLTVDDDPRPGEGEAPGDPNDIPEIEILADRSASADGVQDTFVWQVPALSTLGPGLYYVFAYIDAGDGVHLPQHSVSPGYLLIKDPLSP